MSNTVFGERAVGQIRNLVRQSGTAPDLRPQQQRIPVQSPEDYFVLTPYSGIPKRVGWTIYSALCAVYKPVPTDGTCETYELQAQFNQDGTPFTVRCFNLSVAADVGASKICVSTREKLSGLRYISWEECS